MSAAAAPEVPDDLAADLAALGLVDARSARPLAGGRGGRTWRVDAPHGAYVLHRRGVPLDRGRASVLREERCTSLAHATGVGPQVVAVDGPRGLLLTRWIPGRSLTAPRLREPFALAQTARALRQLHTGALPRHRVRPALDRQRYLSQALATTDALSGVLLATRGSLDALASHLDATVPHDALVHGDVVPGNVIVGARGAGLVDFEYGGRGDPTFDLGNLVASASLDRAAARRLVRAYAADSPDDDPAGRDRLTNRVRAWARVAQSAWIAWVVIGDDVGPRPAAWRAWAERAAVDLMAAHRRSEPTTLQRALDV